METLAKPGQNSRSTPSGLVFGTSDFKKAFLGACADAGLDDVHFHDLRHTAITRMLERGISPPLVMKISGHSQMKTFMRYVNQTEASILDIAQQLDRAA
jgi:integrase